MSTVKPVSFANLLGHDVSTNKLPQGFVAWTVPIYNAVQDDSAGWYYLKTPVSGSVVAGEWTDAETPLERDITMIFPADKGDARDRAFTLLRAEKATGEIDSARVPVDLLILGEAEIVAGSLTARFAEPSDADPLTSVRVWTVPITSFLSGVSNGRPNSEQFFVFLDGPGDSIRSDAGDAKTAVTDDVSFVFPTANLDAKGKVRKRGRTIDVRILNRSTGKSNTVEIPLDK